MNLIKEIGSQVLEYLRRAVTPFFIKLMFGMTMLAVLLINNDALRTILMAVLFLGDNVLTYVLMRSAGENAYKMKNVGRLMRENKPVGSAEHAGAYRRAKEYAPYKGFVIGAVVSIFAIIFIIIGALTGSTGARLALMFVSGWAFLPVFSIYYMVAEWVPNEEGELVMAAMDPSWLWWGLVLVAICIILCGIAYIHGGRREKLRQFMLERRTQTVEAGKKKRAEGGKGAGVR